MNDVALDYDIDNYYEILRMILNLKYILILI